MTQTTLRDWHGVRRCRKPFGRSTWRAFLTRAGVVAFGSWSVAVVGCGSAPASSFASTSDAGTAANRGAEGILMPPNGRQDAGQGACVTVQVNAGVETTDGAVGIPGNVLFVFDQSSSMAEPWGGVPKWQAARDALVLAISSLQSRVNAGVVLFPTSPEYADAAPNAASDASPITDAGLYDELDACADGASGNCLMDGAPRACPAVASISLAPQLPIQAGPAFVGAWTTHWQPGELVLQQGKPLEAALSEAEVALRTPPMGSTALVLITDGAPTCGGNESSIAARLLKERNIATYVVGLPAAQGGSAVLDALAIAGGTSPKGCTSQCFSTPATPTELQDTLVGIATTAVTSSSLGVIQNCTMAVVHPANTEASEPHLVATEVTSGKQYEVPRTPGSWSLSADGQTATLEGAFCESAKAGRFVGFRYQYGCIRVPKLAL